MKWGLIKAFIGGAAGAVWLFGVWTFGEGSASAGQSCDSAANALYVVKPNDTLSQIVADAYGVDPAIPA